MFLKNKNYKLKGNFLHIGFEFGIIIKGIDGILEILGGFLFLMINSTKLSNIVALITQHELSEDPNDLIAHFLLKIANEYSVSTQYFGFFYLLSHGIIKLFLICMLMLKKHWAYPLAIVFLVLFIVYQIYRYVIDHSFLLILLTVFDLIMIFLTWKEYKSLKT